MNLIITDPEEAKPSSGLEQKNSADENVTVDMWNYFGTFVTYKNCLSSKSYPELRSIIRIAFQGFYFLSFNPWRVK